jgi:hypothetical protein
MLYGHVVYPIYIGLKSRGLDVPEARDPESWPAVTVVVAAYREAAVIGAKIDELVRDGYPGDKEIIIVADDPATARAARRPGVTVLFSAQRLGKIEAVNRGVAAATSPIVVLTDANAVMAPDALRAIARHFSDPSIGAVAGEKRVDDPSGAQGFYWKFESWLKQRESATGTTLGVVGELLAFRRDAFKRIPDGVMVDDAWIALDVVEGGRRVVYEPSAYTMESSSPTFRDEWERRIRVVAINLDLLWRRREVLVPGALPVTPQIWGHRLVRSSFGPMAHVGLVGLAVPAAARGSRVAQLFLAGNAVGAASLAAVASGKRQPAPVRLVGQVFFLQAVALGGVRRFLSANRDAAWAKPERVAPGGGTPAAAEDASETAALAST